MKLFAPSVTTSMFYLALVRIAVGLTFLSHFAGQLLGLGGTKSWLFSLPLTDIVQKALTNPAALSFYVTFLEKFVQPNLAVFNYLVLLGELAVGVSLTLGVFTRLGAAAAMILTINVILLKTLPSSDADIDHVFLACELAVLLANAGLAWGLDGLLFVTAPAPRARTAARQPARA